MKTTRNIICLILFLLNSSVQLSYSQSVKKYWVFFTDKGSPLPSSGLLPKNSIHYEEALKYVGSRALERRAKIRSADDLIDAADLPVNESYILQIQNLGGILVQRSRWMNAASFYIQPDFISAVDKLRFVKNIQPVINFRDKRKTEISFSSIQSFSKLGVFDYGQSLAQLQMINIPVLHNLGITGKGVLIGMLDSGFRWKEHEALQTRSILAEHDFIFNDDVTANQVNDSKNQDSHGTLTFSVIGGYEPGKLIGAAFNADYILGKTEYIPSETQQEEDNWVAAIEWMESYGVDVVSSSLGYNDFDPQGPSIGDYTWENGDFDGKTTITAKAAARAARLGVVVCTAMGNEGNDDGVAGTLLTPADTDSIISVGAAAFNRTLWYRSSKGPTNDGRTKPDVVAPGVGVYHATVPGPSTYGASSGTSLATPLTAGVAALLLSARPELTPIQIRDALRSSADTIDSFTYPNRPNNFIGWGLVNSLNAALSFGPILSNEPTITVVSNLSIVSINVISKFGIQPDSVILFYEVGSENTFSRIPMTLNVPDIFSTSGIYRAVIPQQEFGTPIRCHIEANDSAGYTYQSPASILGTQWNFIYGVPGLTDHKAGPATHVLNQNYPNPFHASASLPSGLLPGSFTIISFDLIRTEHVILKVYNLFGEELATLANDVYPKGSYTRVWDASHYPSGVYFYRLLTPSFSETRKMLYIR
jgi:subtilisin family serine protease